MPRKAKRDIEQTYPRRQFIVKIRRLADALEAGKPFTIQIAGERIPIPAHATVNIEHEREGGAEEIEFQLKWRRKQRRARRK
jgi:amphi-Trp domain-containing protein